MDAIRYATIGLAIFVLRGLGDLLSLALGVFSLNRFCPKTPGLVPTAPRNPTTGRSAAHNSAGPIFLLLA